MDTEQTPIGVALIVPGVAIPGFHWPIFWVPLNWYNYGETC